MPMLNRKPFKKQKPPLDLKPDEEVFFCEPTKEIFRSYDDFFERMILCNSLLWSCEITGRYGLTYQEAEESERTASTTVNSIQPELKKPLLLICSLMHKTGLKDLVNEVLKFIRDRFFLGENVQIQKDNATWVNGFVRSIKLHNEVQVNGHAHSGDVTSNAHSSETNGHAHSTDVTNNAHNKYDGGVDPSQVRYQVVMKDGTVRLLSNSRVRRDRRAIGYDRLRMLYRQCTRSEPSQGGRICVRSSVTRRLSLNQLEYHHVFPVGECPVFPPPTTPAAKSALSSSFSSTSSLAVVDGVPSGSQTAPEKQRVFDEHDDTPLSVIKTETKEKWEAERRRQAELRIQERDRRRLKKKQLQDWLKEWSRPREDLLLEDHKELPVFPAVQTRLSPALLGSSLQLMEFVHNFAALLDAEDILGAALSLPFVERALLDNEVAGPLVNLLQVLLRAVFTLQAEEDEESGRRHEKGLHTASADLLDTLTVSEVLRRHLQQGFSSGGEDIGRWRQQQRGGYMDSDCPTHEFRHKRAHILHKLSQSHVLYLSPDERMEVLECLMHEILVSVSARDTIEEADNKARELRAQLRTVRSSISSLQRTITSDTARIQEWRDSETAKSSSIDSHAPTPAPDTPTVPAATTTTTIADSPAAPSAAALEESVVERERRVRDSREQLATAESRERQLQDELVVVSRQVYMQPLGRDRAHRRYWLLPSLPALLIQYGSDSSDTCSTQTELAGVHCVRLAAAASSATTSAASTCSASDPTTQLRALIADRLRQQPGGADVPPHAGLDELIQSGLDVDVVLSSLYCPGSTSPSVDDPDYSRDPSVLQRLLLCTADSTSCPVHTPRQLGEWSCCSGREQLEQLVESLNCRGVREAELKNNLKQIEQSVSKLVEQCPTQSLLSAIVVDDTDASAPVRRQGETVSEVSVSGQQTNLNFALGTVVSHVEEMVLRDWLLEMEEKVQAGALGFLKVEDRLAWREALSQRSYDQQCDKLCWGSSRSPLQNGIETSADGEGSSTSDSPVVSSALLAPAASGCEQDSVVRSMASALLQVEQGIETRFMRAALADCDEMKCWEESLMKSTSLSQLFVHLAQLDSSVQWSCSVLNARCKICRKKSDAENMLLCDNCNRGFHLNCLTPRLKSVPNGDWFCAVCKPKMKPRSPVKRRRETLSVVLERCTDVDALRHDRIAAAPKAPVSSTDTGRRSLPEFSATNSQSSDSSSKQPITRKRRGTCELGPDQFDCAALSDLLASLRNQPGIDNFLRPVKAKEAPHYYRIVREPMDLGTVQQKLNNMGYTTNEQCLADTALVFANCCMYNEKGSDIHTQALRLRRYFNRRLVELGLRRGHSKRSRCSL